MTVSVDQLRAGKSVEESAPKASLALQMAELALLNTPRPEDQGSLTVDYTMPDGLHADGNIRPAQIG